MLEMLLRRCQRVFSVMLMNIILARNQVMAFVNVTFSNNTNTRTTGEDSRNISGINKGVFAIIFLATVFGIVIGVLVIRFCCIRRSNVRGMDSRVMRMKHVRHRALETGFSDLEGIAASEKARVDKICTPNYPAQN